MSGRRADTTTMLAAGQPTLSLRLILILLTLAAIGISGYLAYTELVSAEVACIDSPAFDCGLVQGSAYSKLLGIPVAYIGLLANLGIMGMLLLENRIRVLREYGVTLLAGVLLIALLYSIWLVYVQAVLLKAFCPWCLAHEVVVLAMFIVAAIRLARSLQEA
ncbi:MAG: hypothetical protein Kow00124_01830 [Anaerolineae bacterium]